MADVSVINVTSLTPIVAAAIVSGQQVTIYDNGGIAYRAPIEDVVSAAQALNGSVSVQSKTIKLTPSEVYALDITPVQFGITVPAGYNIVGISGQVYTDFNTASYAGNTTMFIGNEPNMNELFEIDIATVATSIVGMLKKFNPVFYAGTDISIYMLGSPATTGDSDLYVTVSYIIVRSY